MSKELNELVRRVAQEVPGSTRDVAVAVANRTPAARTRDYYIDCLVLKVNEIIGNGRNAALNDVFSPTPPGAPSNSAPRIQRRRDAWAKFLDQQLVFGHQQKKRLGDCTKDDLLAAADYRRDRAAAMERQASRYTEIARLLDVYEVQQVQQLPPDAIDDLEDLM